MYITYGAGQHQMKLKRKEEKREIQTSHSAHQSSIIHRPTKIANKLTKYAFEPRANNNKKKQKQKKQRVQYLLHQIKSLFTVRREFSFSFKPAH
jgi:hypothetical protein